MSEYSASTCERLASELEAADKEMTPGPWTSKGYGFRSERRQIGFCHGFQDGTEDRLESGVIDAHGIAHLRNSAPEVAAALRAAVERVKELMTLCEEACKVADGLVDLAAPGLDTFRDLAVTDIADIRNRLAAAREAK